MDETERPEETQEETTLEGLARGVAAMADEADADASARSPIEGQADAEETAFVVDPALTSDDGRLPIEIATGVSLKSIVEAALFVNERPMTPAEIALPLSLERDVVEDAMIVLAQLQYKKTEAEAMIAKARKANPAIDTLEALLSEIYKQR